MCFFSVCQCVSISMDRQFLTPLGQSIWRFVLLNKQKWWFSGLCLYSWKEVRLSCWRSWLLTMPRTTLAVTAAPPATMRTRTAKPTPMESLEKSTQTTRTSTTHSRPRASHGTPGTEGRRWPAHPSPPGPTTAPAQRPATALCPAPRKSLCTRSLQRSCPPSSTSQSPAWGDPPRTAPHILRPHPHRTLVTQTSATQRSKDQLRHPTDHQTSGLLTPGMRERPLSPQNLHQRVHHHHPSRCPSLRRSWRRYLSSL